MKIMVITVGNRSAYSEEEINARKKNILKYASPNTEIEMHFPEVGNCFRMSGPTELDLTLSAPHIIKKAIEAEQNGFDAVFLHGLYDPGIEAAKHVVNIPVVGPGRVVSHVVAAIANCIGGIAPNDDGIPYLRKMLASYGVLPMFTPIRGINIPLPQARERKAEMKSIFLKLARQAIEEGAEIIFPLCYVNVPVHLSPEELSEELGVPVINGVAIGIKFTEMLVDLGLKHSRKAYLSPNMTKQEIINSIGMVTV